MDKSYVSLATLICPACGKQTENGELLLDRRLNKSMERHTPVGYGLCPDHKKDGYITLIGATAPRPGQLIQPHEARLTGDILFILKEKAPSIFNIPIDKFDWSYIDPEAIEKLKKLAPRQPVRERTGMHCGHIGEGEEP